MRGDLREFKGENNKKNILNLRQKRKYNGTKIMKA